MYTKSVDFISLLASNLRCKVGRFLDQIFELSDERWQKCGNWLISTLLHGRECLDE